LGGFFETHKLEKGRELKIIEFSRKRIIINQLE